ncbi:hypothetical protein A1O7_07039 [Cladophialophora yegresii CBS 114405]|uniref:Fungal N-terminal domain-containing protein n=1 Tax=Cladophialophora yegresii CBS 114405 TaxID=1182544 RepID=W9VUI5_9EURO|nr:uncharacterized protein A1O7_07039 [Cladophialophora yegresii CBS 114405]EXJ56695.1 hypothetical protein A1O7_07039 [Cladophialophora yegresii CBS 114405]
MSTSIAFSESQTHIALADACKLAWHTFSGMQKASEDFENLRFEVWTVAISLDSLHSVGSTSLLIDRQPDHKRWALTFSKILNSLNAALRPLYNLVKLYLSTPARDRAVVKRWLTNQDVNCDGVTVQDFRRKLSMLVESLNVFLSSLTHAELARARVSTETEEYRVLQEVTRTVLQKWDQGRTASTAQGPVGATRSLNQVSVVNDSLRGNVVSSLCPSLSNTSSEGPRAPSWASHQTSPHHTDLHRPAEMLNLDGIETGFRRHMHAMRRIREQLWHQNESKDHLSTQQSNHFPEPLHSSDAKAEQTVMLVPNQPLQVPLTQTDGSSPGVGSVQSSDSSGVVSGFKDEVSRSPSTPAKVNHTRTSSKESGRKRVRSHDTLQPAAGNETMAAVSKDRRPGKTVLEQMLSTAIFFDC